MFRPPVYRRAARRSTAAIFILCTLAALVASADATAAPTWLPSIELSEKSKNAFSPKVAVDQSGDAVAVWAGFEGLQGAIEAATRPAGGGWPAPAAVSGESQSSPAKPDVAVDQSGDAVAVWKVTGAGLAFVIEAATRTAGGDWSAPVELSLESQSAGANEPQVAVDPAGDAVAVWGRRPDATHTVIEAATRPAGGAWSAPVELSEKSGTALLPQVAVDQSGDAVAVWQRSDGPHFVIEAATLRAGGGWSSASRLSDESQEAFFPQVTVDPAGDAVAVWARSDGTHEVIEGATRPPGGDWSAAVRISEESQSPRFFLHPQVALDPSGDAVAIWERSDGTHFVIEAATKAPGGGWSSASRLSDRSQDAEAPQVAVDRSGDAVAVWVRSAGQVVEAATRPAGGDWSAAVELSEEHTEAPQVAADPTGDAVAVWERSNGARTVVESAAYDATPPSLLATSIPTTGTVGARLSFSASAIDAFSGADASWSFGDGEGTVTGFSVPHTYTVPGTYQVTLTVRDGVGNSSVETRPIAISVPPSPGPMPAKPRAPGKALAANLVKVKGSRALLSLRCPSASPPSPCAGTLTITAGHGKKKTLLAAGAFQMAGGTHATVALRLRAKAKRLLADRAARHGLRARLAGTGVQPTAVKLRRP